MNYRHIIISLFFIATVILCIGSFYLRPQPASILKRMQNTAQADAFMEEVTSIILDKDGNAKMKIQAPKMTHFPEKDMTHFYQPHLTIYRKSPQPWYISSQYANAYQGVETVDFWDQVVIQHADDEHSPQTTIKTNKLIVHPNQHTAETNELITLLQPSMSVHAIGMLANLETGDINLLSQAQGEYAPQE